MIKHLLKKLKHNNSKSHKHKDKNSVVVKEYELIRPENNKITFIINNFARDCYNKYFHRFKVRRIYDIEKINGDFVSGIISIRKLKKCLRKWFYTKTNNKKL